MGKFSLCELLRIIDEIEFKELRPILDKKCGPCKPKNRKKNVNRRNAVDGKRFSVYNKRS